MTATSQKASNAQQMANYDPLALHVLAYAHGFTLWHYRLSGLLIEAAGPGFFNPARHLLRPGDRISINSFCNDRFVTAGDYCVTMTAQSDVALQPLSKIAADATSTSQPTTLSASLSPACA